MLFSRKSKDHLVRCNVLTYWQSTLSGLIQPRNVYDSLIPLHLITKCVGLSPFNYNILNEKPLYQTSLLGSSYSFAIMILFVGYYIYAVEERDESTDSNKVARSIDMYHLYGSIIVMSACIILNSYHQKTLIQAVKSLNEADLNMAGYSSKISWKKSRNLIFGYFSITLAVLITCEMLNCTMFLRQVGTLTTYCLLMCYIPMVINSFAEAQFVSYILLLKQRFAILNDELRSLITQKKYLPTVKITKVGPVINREENRPKPIAKSLICVRQMHSQLCEIGALLNKSFSLQILLNTGDVFIGFTTLAYYCFDGCMKLYLNEDGSNLYNTVTTGVWTLVKLSRLLTLTLSCSIVKNEAHLAGHIIYKIDNRYESELSSEIYSFGKQIIHWNLKFTAFNFFDVDMSLFYAVVSSATTYLMILLQLDIANKQIEKSMEINRL
uniref:Gustatory receptor n=1 Tax=Anomala corpulenta TaxID=931571 RepID=A0A0E3Y5B3_9SCAR|nr:gustatory receptor 2 [Anomala corpulenta]